MLELFFVVLAFGLGWVLLPQPPWAVDIEERIRKLGK